MTRHVAVLPGDGIGPEVIEVALDRFRGAFELKMIDAGAERYLRSGELLTPEDMGAITESDALLFGAIGDPRVPDGVLERGILLRLRMELDLYVNLRPFPDIDTVFVRENTEGLYGGQGWTTDSAAAEINMHTCHSVRRCLHYAFRLASMQGRKLTWVHKTNVLTHSGALWQRAVTAMRPRYPDVDVSYEHADAAAYHLVAGSKRYGVVVTDNLFGDILTDVAAGVSGGIGSAASANLHPDDSTRRGRCVGLFEPIHGSAPDIAGTGEADPTAAIRAAEMMLETIGDLDFAHF